MFLIKLFNYILLSEQIVYLRNKTSMTLTYKQKDKQLQLLANGHLKCKWLLTQRSVFDL